MSNYETPQVAGYDRKIPGKYLQVRNPPSSAFYRKIPVKNPMFLEALKTPKCVFWHLFHRTKSKIDIVAQNTSD